MPYAQFGLLLITAQDDGDFLKLPVQKGIASGSSTVRLEMWLLELSNAWSSWIPCGFNIQYLLMLIALVGIQFI